MREHTLTVEFRGICTHFRGVVAGVPHRVVLPDASPRRSGRVQVGSKPPEPYDIHSHVPVITANKDELDVPGFIERGKKGHEIVNGVRLAIVNAIGPLAYDETMYGEIFALKHFVPQYAPSVDVLYAGRARCYFDLFSGTVKPVWRAKALNADVVIRTDGRPMLQVTPLIVEPPSQTTAVWYFELESNVLSIVNKGDACAAGGEQCKFDFLLNYLTAAAGLPHVVTADFPIESRADAPIGKLDEEGELVICSDSRYP